MASAAKALVIAVLILTLSTIQHSVNGAPVVPCYFIFGDSLADNGNNNQLATKAKANYPPYGVDLPSAGSSGRFTNGRTIVDLISQTLGFRDFILPFATASGQDILRGVNYASASSGILDESGSNLGEHVSLNGQLRNHKDTVTQIGNLMKDPLKTSQLLGSCLYTVGMGSNDYINNYFLPASHTKMLYNPDQYACHLISQYTSQLETLHLFGARKIALFGAGKIGCTPFAITHGNGSCIGEFNSAVQIFNDKLKLLVDQLNAKFPDSKFIYVNIFGIPSPAMTNDITVTAISCCPATDTGVCTPNSTPCRDRSIYAFFDDFHPAEALNQIMASRAFKAALPTDAYPMDISHLVQSCLQPVPEIVML